MEHRPDESRERAAGVARYQDNETWVGVNQHSEKRTRKRNANLLLNVQAKKKTNAGSDTESNKDSSESDVSDSDIDMSDASDSDMSDADMSDMEID